MSDKLSIMNTIISKVKELEIIKNKEHLDEINMKTEQAMSCSSCGYMGTISEFKYEDDDYIDYECPKCGADRNDILQHMWDRKIK